MKILRYATANAYQEKQTENRSIWTRQRDAARWIEWHHREVAEVCEDSFHNTQHGVTNECVRNWCKKIREVFDESLSYQRTLPTSLTSTRRTITEMAERKRVGAIRVKNPAASIKPYSMIVKDWMLRFVRIVFTNPFFFNSTITEEPQYYDSGSTTERVG